MPSFLKISFILSLLLALVSCNKDKLLISKNEQVNIILGAHCVQCESQMLDIEYIEETHGIREYIRDSVFKDTLIITILREKPNIDALIASHNEIDNHTLFISTSLNKRKINDDFIVNEDENNVYFISTNDPYSCKCRKGLSIRQDSVYYAIYYPNSFFHIKCKGPIVN